MKPKMDLIAGIFLFIFSVIMYQASFSIRMMFVSRVGSRFVPQLIAIAIGVLSLVLVVQSLLRMKAAEKTARAEKGEAAPPTFKEILPVAGTFLALILYAVLFEPLGFIVTTALYLFVQFYLLTGTVKRNYIVFALSAVLTSVVVYYIFVEAFHLMLPPGILG